MDDEVTVSPEVPCIPDMVAPIVTGPPAADPVASPAELIVAHLAHGIDLLAVVKTNEVHAFMREAVPASALRALAEAFVIHRAVIGCDIVLTRDIKRLTDSGALDELLRSIELSRFGRVGDIAGMN